MTGGKEAHQKARRDAIGCPCCGAPLLITAGESALPISDPINKMAKSVMVGLSMLHYQGHVRLVTVEDAAEAIQDGRLLDPSTLEPSK